MDVFTEAFLHQLLPFMEEITFPAIIAFGYVDKPPLQSAILGAFTAGILLFVLGQLFRLKAPAKVRQNADELGPRLRPMFYPLLLVISSPAGFAIAFGAGLFKAQAKYAVPLILIGVSAQYAYQVFGG